MYYVCIVCVVVVLCDDCMCVLSAHVAILCVFYACDGRSDYQMFLTLYGRCGHCTADIVTVR